MASLCVNQKTHFVWIFFLLWAKYFVREIILQLHSINLYWNNFVPKKTYDPCKYLLFYKLLINENHTHSSHLFQCPSEKPCTEEKRFSNKILDSPQPLSSTLNTTRRDVRNCNECKHKGELSQEKERSYISPLILNPLTTDTFYMVS